MDKSFYSEISEMCEEALQALSQYEATGKTDEVFDKIRSIGVACLDGEKINPSIKNDLSLRDFLEFQRAVFNLAQFNTLSGVGQNLGVKSNLEKVRNKSKELSAKVKNKESCTVFYSWQSSLSNKTNRGLIKECLERAIKEINKEILIETRVSLDSDTSNISGSPDIIHTILSKIDKSSVFIADVSMVNGTQPNSNVMFELGYAMKSLGDASIIMIFNDSYGEAKNLPFDLGFKRQMIYSCLETDNDIPQVRKQLTQKLKQAIEAILISS